MNPMKVEGYDRDTGMLHVRALNTGQLYGVSVTELANAMDTADPHSAAPGQAPVGGSLQDHGTDKPYSGMPAPDAPGAPDVPTSDDNVPQFEDSDPEASDPTPRYPICPSCLQNSLTDVDQKGDDLNGVRCTDENCGWSS